MAVCVPPHIEDLEPYRPGKPIADLMREKNLSTIVKLASNENPLGPSPKTLVAMQHAMADLHRYPDPRAMDLVTALSKNLGRKPAEIVCGNGSDSLLAYLLYAFTKEDDEVLTSSGSFIGMYVNARKLGRRLNLVSLRNYAYDLPALAAAITPKTKVVYLANPNNPTGTMFSKNEFEGFMANVPRHVLVILDEAYTLYAEDFDDYPNGLKYHFDNLVVLRTFSKAYGLAGLRVGFAVGPERLIAEIYKVKLPFEPNWLAQVAACAALDDREFLERTKTLNAASLEAIRRTLTGLGIKYVDTVANFLMMLFSGEPEATTFYEACLNEGLILRPLKSFGLGQGVRINSGTEEETAFAARVIEKVWKSMSPSQRTSKELNRPKNPVVNP